ncbi:MAG: hypothetical protein HZA22_12925 [Nitrospirae bacterium]|nr:hypothetical protein [Nitrospirota bacterium]
MKTRRTGTQNPAYGAELCHKRDSISKTEFLEVPYIHFNPVKHGHVKYPKDWEYSTFYKYVNEDVYTLDWGAGADIAIDGIGIE